VGVVPDSGRHSVIQLSPGSMSSKPSKNRSTSGNGRTCDQMLGRLPVGSEIVLPAEQEVIDPGDVRRAGVDVRRAGVNAARRLVISGHLPSSPLIPDGCYQGGRVRLGAVQAPVAGILLAAGEGSRFGQPKALVELDGQTLAERGVNLLRTGGTDPILVVTGAAPVQLAGTQTVYNEQWRTGMGSSLRAALRALAAAASPPDVGAVVVALADQPLVGAAAVARLIEAYRAGATVAVAAYHGQPRNPVLIAREHWPEVAAMAAGDQGARAFLRARADLVTLIECADTGTPDDIDTPADLDRVNSRHRGSLLPLSGQRSRRLDAPGVGDGLAGVENQQVVGAYEGVRRAGHGLDGDRFTAAVRPERVARENLQPLVALAGP
jgi:CTP:molybdopterin cytidylyltransferase MocA